jgi:hypothetical protein
MIKYIFGSVGITGRCVVDETEATGFLCVEVSHDLGTGDYTVRAKDVDQVLFCAFWVKASYVETGTGDCLLHACAGTHHLCHGGLTWVLHHLLGELLLLHHHHHHLVHLTHLVHLVHLTHWYSHLTYWPHWPHWPYRSHRIHHRTCTKLTHRIDWVLSH